MARASTPAEVWFYSETDALGGAERAMFRLIEWLPRELWSPVVMLPDGPALTGMQALAEAQSVPVRVIDPIPLGLGGALTARTLLRELRRGAPAVFHAHLSQPLAAKWALSAAVLARVPAVVATVHLTPFHVDRSSAVQLRLLSRGVGAYIAVSNAVARDLTEEIGLPRGKVEVIRNWIDPRPLLAAQADLAARDAPASAARPRGRVTALTPARLDHQKGLDVLLDAATQLRDVRFTVAGDGPDRAALTRRADELGLLDSGTVSFLGPRSDVPALLAACDLVVLPSRFEGTSLAVLEAMAARCPIVSTDIPGTDEQLVNGTSALLVPPEDPDALAAAIRRLLEDPGLADRLAAAAQERALTEFAPERLTGATVEVYRRLLGRRQPARESS